MKDGIIIQARTGSTRLHNKILLPFYGEQRSHRHSDTSISIWLVSRTNVLYLSLLHRENIFYILFSLAAVFLFVNGTYAKYVFQIFPFSAMGLNYKL